MPACARGTPGGRARSRGARIIVQSFFGISAATANSTLTGSVSLVHRQRRTSRPKCVSTVMPGTPKALPSTTLAVLRPKPGSVTSSSSRFGHLAVEALDQHLAELDERRGLVAEEAGGLDQLFELGIDRRRRSRPRVAVAREQGRRHLVDALVGALCGQDRGYRQLERSA